MELLSRACKPRRWRLILTMFFIVLADVSRHDFNPARENAGMVAMGVIVLVTWLAFRQMLKLSNRKKP